jgi:hypothetical protein
MFHIQSVLFKMQPKLQVKRKLIYDINIILFDTFLAGYASKNTRGLISLWLYKENNKLRE